MSDSTEKFAAAVEDRDLEALQNLLDRDRVPDDREYSVLRHICEVGWPEGLRALLERHNVSAGLNFFDEFSWSPLILAVKAGSAATVRLLLDSGVDVNQHDDDRAGNTALTEAVDIGSLELVRLLCE